MANDFDTVNALESLVLDTRGDMLTIPGHVAVAVANEVRSVIRLTGVVVNYSADIAAYNPDPLFVEDYMLSRKDALGIIWEIKTMRERYQGEIA